MIGFLKGFFSNEKSHAEQALLATQKKRDVITMAANEEDQPKKGCGCSGGCGCGNGGCGCGR